MRTVRRRPVNFLAFVRETAARVVSVEVTDLSTDGCKFESPDAFETATIVWLKIAGLGARQARIIWHRGGGYGCEFLSPMQSDAVEDLCAAKAASLRAKNRVGAEGFGRSRG
jgi:hypothetical protein